MRGSGIRTRTRTRLYPSHKPARVPKPVTIPTRDTSRALQSKKKQGPRCVSGPGSVELVGGGTICRCGVLRQRYGGGVDDGGTVRCRRVLTRRCGGFVVGGGGFDDGGGGVGGTVCHYRVLTRP